jgi:hypothetical protein
LGRILTLILPRSGINTNSRGCQPTDEGSEDQFGPVRAGQFRLPPTAGSTCGYSGLALSGRRFKNSVKLRPSNAPGARSDTAPERGCVEDQPQQWCWYRALKEA